MNLEAIETYLLEIQNRLVKIELSIEDSKKEQQQIKQAHSIQNRLAKI